MKQSKGIPFEEADIELIGNASTIQVYRRPLFNHLCNPDLIGYSLLELLSLHCRLNVC